MGGGRSSEAALDGALASATGLGLVAAMYAALVYAPTDAYQQDVQRIFYVHLAMWLPTFTAFFLVAVASLLYLIKRTPFWDRFGRAAAELGLLFCTLGLVTGSIWAKPIWGVWWTWDPRLTLTLVLWMIYAAYLLLRTLALNPEQGAVLAAILGVTGVIDLWLIRMAVYWWRGIHPAGVITTQGAPGLPDPRMRLALVISIAAFFLLFVWLLCLRVRTGRLQEEVEELREAVAQA